MSALRRDLVERKLWMVAAMLLVAVIAVPVLLLKTGSSAGAPAVPAAPAAAGAAAASTTQTTSAKASEPAKKTATLAKVDVRRDPFVVATSTTSTTSSTTTAAAASSTPASTASTASTGSSSATAATAMVTPSPASASSANTSSASTPSSTTSAASTAHAASSGPVSTTASVTPAPAAKTASWTLYSVAMRYGKDVSARLRSNIARLTAFPSAANPQVMFLGVMTGGKQAVFALRADVGHTGPGLCRPAHTRCSAIVLKPGQTEHLAIPVTGGTPKPMILRLVHISHTVTHSRKTALAAYERYSAAGLCDLALADPVLYNLGTGTVSGIPKAVCAHQPASVPFTPLVTTP
jgi:hypothetical protein